MEVIRMLKGQGSQIRAVYRAAPSGKGSTSNQWVPFREHLPVAFEEHMVAPQERQGASQERRVAF